MNSYERIYNILTESTPIGREGSKKIGQTAAKTIATTISLPIDPKHKEEVKADIRKKAQQKGTEEIKTDPATIAIKQSRLKQDLISKRGVSHRKARFPMGPKGSGPNPIQHGTFNPGENPLRRKERTGSLYPRRISTNPTTGARTYKR